MKTKAILMVVAATLLSVSLVEVKSAYHLYPWEIVQDGKTMALADEDGVPSWAGGRQRNEDCCMRGCRHGKGRGRR